VYSVAEQRPEEYATAVIELYERGQTRMRGLKISPRREVRMAKPPSDMNHVDYMLLTSLRDSENWWMSPVGGTPDFASMTSGSEVEKWFRNAGFTEVKEMTWVTRKGSKLSPMGDGHKTMMQMVKVANHYYKQGWQVVLLIDSDVLEKSTQDDRSYWPDHWVGLVSEISNDNPALDDYPTSMTVYQRGGKQTIPEHNDGSLTLDDFVRYFYGFVAAKP
jgi:hypothetical protein